MYHLLPYELRLHIFKYIPPDLKRIKLLHQIKMHRLSKIFKLLKLMRLNWVIKLHG
jgi:hypothetical protein